jgi:hypothetical protein
MDKDNDQVAAACRELRVKRLGNISQQKMATLLETTTGSVQRYEGIGPPKLLTPDAPLALYVVTAAKHGHHDLARVFREAMDDELRDYVLEAIDYQPQQPAGEKPRVVGGVTITVPKRIAPILIALKRMIENPADKAEAAFANWINVAIREKMEAAAETTGGEPATNAS